MFRKIKWFVKSVTLSKMKHMKCILWWRKEGDVREGNVNENGSLQIAPRPFKPPDAGPLSFSNSPIHEPGSSNIVQDICLQQEFFSSSANFVGESQTCSGLPFITMCCHLLPWPPCSLWIAITVSATKSKKHNSWK